MGIHGISYQQLAYSGRPGLIRQAASFLWL